MNPEHDQSQPGNLASGQLTHRGCCLKCGERLYADAPRGVCLRCLSGILSDEQEVAPGFGSLDAEGLPRTFAGFELLEVLGRGGMGVVYRARDLRLDREVAIKVLPDAFFAGPSSVLRFQGEARATAALRHPNIVAVHEVGEFDGHPYFAMDLVRGKTLSQGLADQVLEPKQSASLIREIAQAVAYAHLQGILHRDIKPSNILITDDGSPRLTDFGVACRLDAPSDLTLTGQVIGTPNYMPPEQVRGEKDRVGPASDVYSLGAVLYRMLSGRAPATGESIHATLNSVLHADPVPPSVLNPAVPHDLQVVCLKCLSKEVSARYESASALADDLGRFLRSEPVHAKATPLWERAIKWTRRHPSRFAGLCLGLSFLLTAGVMALHHDHQMRLQRDVAMASAEEAVRSRRQLELHQAFDKFENNLPLQALSQLGRLLKQDPSNTAAAVRLASALTHRSYLLHPFPALRHPAGVRSAVYSPDGQRVVTTAADGKIRFWNTRDGGLDRSMDISKGPMIDARFSPSGRWVMAASQSGQITFLAADSGFPEGKGIQAPAAIQWVRWHPRDDRLLAVLEDQSVQVWKMSDATPVLEPIKHASRVAVAEFNPDGTGFMIGLESGEIHLRQLDGGKRLGEVVKTFRPLRNAVFDPEGTRLATAAEDPRALIWSAGTGGLLKSMEWRPATPYCVAFSPDGKRLAVGSLDGSWMLYDTSSRARLITPSPLPAAVISLVFSPEGERLLVVGADQTAQIFDSQSGTPLADPVTHPAPIRTAGFNPDGTQIMVAGGSEVRVWEAARSMRMPLVLPLAPAATIVRFSPDGQHLAAAGADGIARVWDVRSGTLLSASMEHFKDIMIRSLTYSHDGRHVATGSADRRARVWRMPSGEPEGSWMEHSDIVLSVQFDPQGGRVVTGSADDHARVWDLKGRLIGPAMRHPGDVMWVGFSRDGRVLVTGCEDGKVRFWDSGTGQLKAGTNEEWAHAGSVVGAAWSPDRSQLATFASDGSLVLGEPMAARPDITSTLHLGPITWAEFGRDGSDVFTAGADGRLLSIDPANGNVRRTVRFPRSVSRAAMLPGRDIGVAVTARGWVDLWNLEAGNRAGERLRHFGTVPDIDVSPDGEWVAVGGQADRGVRLWQIPRIEIPLPGWLLDLAEALGGGAAADPGRGGITPETKELWELQQRIQRTTGQDAWSKWGRWFVDLSESRTVMPGREITVESQLQRLVEDTSRLLHYEAVRLAPRNPRALARLGLDVIRLENKSRNRGEATLLIRLAEERAPQDPEVQRCRRELDQIEAGRKSQE